MGRATMNAGMTTAALALLSLPAMAGPSGGAFSIPWSTIDGGGVLNSSGGSYTLSGTIGQPDAGATMSGGSFSLTGGFWAGVGSTAAPCPADLTGEGDLNFLDVSAFLSAFGVMDPSADFTGEGQFNFLDVSAFLSAFAAGCP
ncbi:MAG: GC-type dockerin domain-anchored protein [Phycisphaerales bacterium]